MKPLCNVCQRRPAINPEGGTCGDSYCSEYRNCASRIRNAPKGKRGDAIRTEALARMSQIDETIQNERRYTTA